VTSFHDFGLAEPITRAITEQKYTTPTAIQSQTIPAVLSRRDVIGIAQTGTGKTAAFALPILHHILTDRPRPERKTCRVLVLSPTRELSGQILDSFRVYGRHLRISAALAIGGVPLGRQMRALLNGVEVLVATPGRLLDLLRGNALRLGAVEFLVLDEADRMLDMGFIHDIRKIIAKIPLQRQTLLFSATMPRAIAELANQLLRNPTTIAVTPIASTVERVEQRILRVDRAAKPVILAKILKSDSTHRALVFTRTKHGADRVVRALVTAGIAAEAIHGNKSQNQRDRVLAAFRNGAVRTLVATDIAARGIDVDGISHVVNFDLPNVPETYVHRIGRTARAGEAGVAISLCDAEEVPLLREIEKLIRMAIPATDLRSAGERYGQSAAQSRKAVSPDHTRSTWQQRHRSGADFKKGGRDQSSKPGTAGTPSLKRDVRAHRRFASRSPR
jgi:ATP-dependent RNA helicase RhlE